MLHQSLNISSYNFSIWPIVHNIYKPYVNMFNFTFTGTFDKGTRSRRVKTHSEKVIMEFVFGVGNALVYFLSATEVPMGKALNPQLLPGTSNL